MNYTVLVGMNTPATKLPNTPERIPWMIGGEMTSHRKSAPRKNHHEPSQSKSLTQVHVNIQHAPLDLYNKSSILLRRPVNASNDTQCQCHTVSISVHFPSLSRPVAPSVDVLHARQNSPRHWLTIHSRGIQWRGIPTVLY